jgi:2-oxoglutarate-Fe(II)-dependent oxygenase superfamily protein
MAQAAPRPAEVPTAPATFIQGYPQALPRALCEEIVARFEQDGRKHPSRTATRLNPLVRSGTMLDIPLYPEWADVCALVTRVTRACLDDYTRRYPMLQSLAKPENCLITPPFIERIEPGQGYGYHIDAGPGGTHDRLVSGLFYLRDIDGGGHTEFPFQLSRIVPRAGLLMLFPPFWTHLHRGVSPARTVKYNISNYVVIRPRADLAKAPPRDAAAAASV